MKILKYGYIRQVECDFCKGIIEYNIKEDAQGTDKIAFDLNSGNLPFPYFYIKCPICHEEINVTKHVKEAHDLGFFKGDKK